MSGRRAVLAALVLLSVITYLDRVCLGLAATDIRSELDISKEHWGWVIAVFSVSYGLLEIPSGAWGDRFGHRAVLTRIVVWWSAFTALTATVWWFEPIGFGEKRLVEPPLYELPPGSGNWVRHRG